MSEESLVQNLTEDEFLERFKPVLNHLISDDVCSWDGIPGIMFETYGNEHLFVLSNPPQKVWTLTETEGQRAIVSGHLYANRLGYFVTEIPVGDGEIFQVILKSGITKE